MNTKINELQVKHITFQNVESNIRHHYYDEDMEKYELIRKGDLHAIDMMAEAFGTESHYLGKLSMDPLRNFKYLFVCAVTLTCRFCIEGGLNSEFAYNASDLYIRKADSASGIEEIKNLVVEMASFYTNQMIHLQKRDVCSLPVIHCQDYIEQHLHQKISLPELASAVNLNPNYLSRLFKKETGKSVTEYITEKRINTAENLLKYSDYSISTISSYLNFNNQSYFNKIFKKYTGMTPNSYRKKYFRTSFKNGS